METLLTKVELKALKRLHQKHPAFKDWAPTQRNQVLCERDHREPRKELLELYLYSVVLALYESVKWTPYKEREGWVEGYIEGQSFIIMDDLLAKHEACASLIGVHGQIDWEQFDKDLEEENRNHEDEEQNV